MHLRPARSLLNHLTTGARTLLVVAVATVLAACSADVIDKLADKEKQRIALDYIKRLREGDLAGLARELHPDLKNGRELEQLGQMRQILPVEEPTSTALVGYWTGFDTRVGSWSTLVYQLGYEQNRWMIVTLQWIETKDHGRVIQRFHLNPQAEDLKQAHAFSLRHATLKHYATATAVIIVGAFVLTTFVICLRTRGLRRKWLWALLTLVSISQCSFNWSTGEFGFSPIYLSLLGVGAMKMTPYNPWILSFGLPVGAIIFWLRRRSLTSTDSPPAEPPPPPFSGQSAARDASPPSS